MPLPILALHCSPMVLHGRGFTGTAGCQPCGVPSSIGAQYPDQEQGHIDATEISSFSPPYDLVRGDAGIFLVMGPLPARMGCARIALPEGGQ